MNQEHEQEHEHDGDEPLPETEPARRGVRIDLAKLGHLWPCLSTAVKDHPAVREVERIRADARRLGWPDWRLDELVSFLEPGEVIAVIGESIGLTRRAGSDVRRWFSRRPRENDYRE